MTDMKSAYDEISAETGKSRILDNMKHDIRSPMHAVKGLTSILAASGPLTPRQREIVDKLETSTGNLFTLIDSMLDLVQVNITAQDKRRKFPVNPRLAPMQENNKINKQSAAVTINHE